MGEFVVEGFFSLQVVTFFATLTANYGSILHFSTAFNWLPSDIMSWALGNFFQNAQDVSFLMVSPV